MNEIRIEITPNNHIILVSEVGGNCPLCEKGLMYKKKNGQHKGYEVAHIYPLNPSPQEIELLKNEERLSDDVNDNRNLIPLCLGCHGKFDKPRTVEEYRELLDIKKDVLAYGIEKTAWNSYPVKNEVVRILESLSQDIEFLEGDLLSYDPLTIDSKVNGKVRPLLKNKIKIDVRMYFSFVQELLGGLEKESPGISDVIANQVKTYYLDQVNRKIDYNNIYKNISLWIGLKTKSESPEACQILVSFFVQNCEVFS